MSIGQSSSLAAYYSSGKARILPEFYPRHRTYIRSPGGDTPPLPDLFPLPKETEQVLEILRPRIKEYFNRPRLPIWMPQEGMTEKTSQFYRDLALPSVNGKPNLLLHGLGLDSNLQTHPLSLAESHW